MHFPQEHGDARAGSSVSHSLVHPHGSRGHPYCPDYLRNHVGYHSCPKNIFLFPCSFLLWSLAY